MAATRPATRSWRSHCLVMPAFAGVLLLLGSSGCSSDNPSSDPTSLDDEADVQRLFETIGPELAQLLAEGVEEVQQKAYPDCPGGGTVSLNTDRTQVEFEGCTIQGVTINGRASITFSQTSNATTVKLSNSTLTISGLFRGTIIVESATLTWDAPRACWRASGRVRTLLGDLPFNVQSSDQSCRETGTGGTGGMGGTGGSGGEGGTAGTGGVGGMGGTVDPCDIALPVPAPGSDLRVDVYAALDITPIGISFAADGTLFIGTNDADQVSSVLWVSPDGTSISESPEQFDDPDALIVDRDGRIADTAGNVLIGGSSDGGNTGQIVEMTPEGVRVDDDPVPPDPCLRNINHLVFDRDNRLLATNFNNESANVCAVLEGNPPENLPTVMDLIPDVQGDGPAGVTVQDPNTGDLFVTSENTVYRYNLDGIWSGADNDIEGTAFAYGPEGSPFEGLLIRRSGMLLVRNLGTDEETPLLTGSVGSFVTFDADANLYISDPPGLRVLRVSLESRNLPPTAVGCHGFTIEGQVVDDAMLGLDGVNVRAILGSVGVGSVTTADGGLFEIDVDQVGSYRLCAIGAISDSTPRRFVSTNCEQGDDEVEVSQSSNDPAFSEVSITSGYYMEATNAPFTFVDEPPGGDIMLRLNYRVWNRSSVPNTTTHIVVGIEGVAQVAHPVGNAGPYSPVMQTTGMADVTLAASEGTIYARFLPLDAQDAIDAYNQGFQTAARETNYVAIGTVTTQ